MEPIRLNTIEEAIADFKEGNFVIVVDDEDRENEGDFIIAAEKITPDVEYFVLQSQKNVALSWNWICRCRPTLQFTKLRLLLLSTCLRGVQPEFPCMTVQ